MSESLDPYTARGFDALIGAQITELTPQLARSQFEVSDQLRQPFGLLHGGVFAAVAESLASVATAVEVFPDRMAASGLSNQTSFLRPALSGTVYAVAVRKHAGRTTWVWEVEFFGQSGELYALTRMTIAVRPLREGEQSIAPGGR